MHFKMKLKIVDLFKSVETCFERLCSIILRSLPSSELDSLSSLIPKLFPLLAFELLEYQDNYFDNHETFLNTLHVNLITLDIIAPLFQNQPSPKYILGLDLFLVEQFYYFDSELYIYNVHSRKPLVYTIHNKSRKAHLSEYQVIMKYISELIRLTPVIDTYVLMRSVLLIQKHIIINKNRLCAAIYDDLYSIVEKHQEKIYDSAAFMFLLNHTPSAMSLYTPENLSRWESVYVNNFENKTQPDSHPPADFYTRLLIESTVHQQVELFDLLVEGYLSGNLLYESFRPDSEMLSILFNSTHTALSDEVHFRSSYLLNSHSPTQPRINCVSERYMYEMYDIRNYINQYEYIKDKSEGSWYYSISRKYNQIGLELLVRIIDFSEKSNISLTYLNTCYYSKMTPRYFIDYLQLPTPSEYHTGYPKTSTVVEMLSTPYSLKRSPISYKSIIYLDLLMRVGDRPKEKNSLSWECLETSFTHKFYVSHIGLLLLWKKHHNSILCYQEIQRDPNTSEIHYQTILHLLMSMINRIPDEYSFNRLLEAVLSVFDDIEKIKSIEIKDVSFP